MDLTKEQIAELSKRMDDLKGDRTSDEYLKELNEIRQAYGFDPIVKKEKNNENKD